MAQQAGRWLEITPSPFPHESKGLNRVRAVLPNHAPFRAWSNFEFRDGHGKWHEIDLLVLGRRRLHLVELKYYSGTLRGDDHRWLRDGHRVEDSPLKLARRKAQRLASKLQDELLRWAVGDSLLHGPGQQTLHGDTDLSGFAYATENLDVLQTILAGGRYDVVVGNPPYITVKDKVLNQAYRERYSTCKGTYALTVPFTERFFSLAKPGYDAQPAGWTGQITSNSFMKREFGSKLIEEFLALKDLRLVADTSGAYIPGHGTPTVILVGRTSGPSGRPFGPSSGCEVSLGARTTRRRGSSGRRSSSTSTSPAGTTAG